MIFSGSACKRNAGNRNPQRQYNRKSCQRVGGVHQGHAAVVLDPDEESCFLVHFTGGDLRGIFYIWNGHIPTETYPEPVWHIRCLGGNSQRLDTNLARPFPLPKIDYICGFGNGRIVTIGLIYLRLFIHL